MPTVKEDDKLPNAPSDDNEEDTLGILNLYT